MTTRRVSLLLAVVALSPGWPAFADEVKRARADEARLEAAGLKHDSDSLLQFLRHRSLTDPEREEVELVIAKLGARAFRTREQAQAQLVARGPVVVELLRDHMKRDGADLELVRRAAQCVERIKAKDHPPEVPAAAVRLLAHRKPEGALPALLLYLPFADNETVADEVRVALAAVGIQGGKADRALVDALADRHPVRRAGAAEALTRAKLKEHEPAVAKLLKDADPTVRLRVAVALAGTEKREAIQELIDLLVPLPQHQAWQAEDILYRLGQGHNPPRVSLGSDAAARKQCRDAWDAWWRQHGDKVSLAKLRERPRLLGHTVIVLLDLNRVLEVDAQGKTVWQVEGVNFPLDIEYLPNDRILAAEYHAAQVTERDLRGEVKWRYRVANPIAAQRLPGGNTFIATDSGLVEVDREGKEVFSHNFGDRRVMKAMKIDNGDIVCLTSDARVVRLDARGKELSSFEVPLGVRLYGGRIHMLPNGRVLVPHHGENKVVEYDAAGKPLWEVAIEQPIMATRLPNGNTLVTSMNQNRAVEYDREGREVWSYRSDTRVTRAVRR